MPADDNPVIRILVVTLMDEMLLFHRSGKVRVIGTFSDKRSELMPEIPTMAEQGIKVAGGEGWRILATPQVREALTKRLWVTPHYLNAQQIAQRQRTALAIWEPAIKASGFNPE